MSTYIWFVPGFMGSALSLYQQTPGSAPPGRRITDLWGTEQAIFNGAQLPLLTLPGSLPVGQSIQASGLASIAGEGYENFSLYVVNNMPAGFIYSPWAYDWRQSASVLGPQLAAQLQSTNVKGNQNIVVAHSYGALVAWAAWAALVDAGQQSAMTRLITIGGALYGSESAPNIFREDETGLDGLTLLLTYLGGGPFGVSAFLGVATPYGTQTLTLQLQRMLAIAASWPSLYDLFPDFSMLDDPGDTNRNLLGTPSAWNAALVPPNFVLMGAEIMNVHQHVRQAKYAIPATQVAHIVGNAHNTPSRVLPPSMTPQQAFQYGLTAVPRPNNRQIRQLALPSFNTVPNGDGRCTMAQQMFPGGYFQTVASQHAAMQNDPAVQQLVVQLLTMTIPTQPPTPPLQVQTVWNPPSALPNAPPFIFNSDPVNTQAAPDTPNNLGRLKPEVFGLPT